MKGEDEYDEYNISDFIQSHSPLALLSYQSLNDEDHTWTFWSKEDDDCPQIISSSSCYKISLGGEPGEESDVDDGRWNVFGAEHNYEALACLNKRVEMLEEERENKAAEEFFIEVAKTNTNAEITTIHTTTTETLQNDREVVAQLSDFKSVMEAGRKNELNVVISEQNGVAVTYSEGISSREEISEKERETNKLSREDPRRHVGKKLDDVPDKRGEQSRVAIPSSRQKKSSRAEKTESVYTVKGIPITRKDLLRLRHLTRKQAANSLGIGLTSLQNVRAHFGYDKWPPGDTVSNASSTCDVKNVNDEEEEVVTRKRKRKQANPSCSNPPPIHSATATVVAAHIIPNVTPQKDIGTMTTYLKYRGDTYRIQLLFPSTVLDLKEKVSKRRSLDEGSFAIKYRDNNNELISIAVDEDVEEFISILRSLGEKSVKLMVLPITNQAS